jgi:hypothetical protein
MKKWRSQMFIEWNVRSEVRLFMVIHLFDFLDWYFISIILLPSILHTQISRDVLFFNPTSEYVYYFFKETQQ